MTNGDDKPTRVDTDFFTRVGLTKYRLATVFDWVREDLVTPLAQGTYGTVERFTQEVRGYAKKGRLFGMELED